MSAPESMTSKEGWNLQLQARVRKLEAALKPFAEIALLRDDQPNEADMLDMPDFCIQPSQIRAARDALKVITVEEIEAALGESLFAAEIERGARAACIHKRVNPECLHWHEPGAVNRVSGLPWPDDETLSNGKPAHRGWRIEVPLVEAVLAAVREKP